MSDEPKGKTSILVVMALLAGATMAMMEISAILSSGGTPVLSPLDLILTTTWLGLAYALLLGVVALVGGVASLPLARRGANSIHLFRGVFGGLAISIALLVWLRGITRLGDRTPVYPVLSLVILLGAAGAGVCVAVLTRQLSLRGSLRQGGIIWVSLLAGLGALIIVSRPRPGPFGQAGSPPGLLFRLLAGAVVVTIFFLVLRLVARRGTPQGWMARVVTGGLLVWTLFALHDFSRFATRAGVVKDVDNGGALAATGSMAGGRPNLLLVSIDTLRADHVSSYGHDRETTPRLDALAAEGIRFDKTAATSSFTTPTHASMLTGLFPVTHGAVYQKSDPSRFVINPMLPSVETLAEVLEHKGYDTAGFVASPMVGSQFGFDRGFRHFDDDYSRLRSTRGQLFSRTLLFRLLYLAGLFDESDIDAERSAGEVNQRVFSWLSGRGESSSPFFLFVHYYDPHAPYDPPAGVNLGLDLDRSMAILDMPALLKREYTLSPPAWRRVLDLYDAEIHATDARLGEILDKLDQAGELDNTLVVVTSDHGESFGEHGHWGHNMFLYEDLLRVPLVVRLPGGASGGRVVDGVVAQHTDILPTVLAQMEIDPPEGIQGRDLSAWIRGEPSMEEGLKSPVLAFADLQRDVAWSRNWGGYLDRDLTTVRADRWKYIRSSNGVEELYDLEADPGEMVNLYKTDRETLESMRTLLDSWEATQVPGAGPEGTIDQGVIENLRSLGYVQ